jgi:hypothetical protein
MFELNCIAALSAFVLVFGLPYVIRLQQRRRKR